MEKTITVYANPYAAVDHNGEPHAAVPMVDREGHIVRFRYVGALRDDATGAKLGHNVFDFLKDEEGNPVATKVPFEGQSAAYYAKKILEGELIVASKDDAALCGISPNDFKPALEQLAIERAHAAHRHHAQFGTAPMWAPAQAGGRAGVTFGGHAAPQGVVTNAQSAPSGGNEHATAPGDAEGGKEVG